MSTVTHAFSWYLVCITIVDWRTGMVSPLITVRVFLEQFPSLLVDLNGLYCLNQLATEECAQYKERTHIS